MKAWTYRWDFKENLSPALQKIDTLAHRADQSMERLQSVANRAGNRVTSMARRGAEGMRSLARSTDRADRQMNQFNSTVNRLKNTFLAYLGLDVARQFGMTAVNTRAQMEGLNNSIKFSSGSAEEAQRNMKFLDDTVNVLGLDLMSSKKGFADVIGAFRNSKLEGQGAREVFGAVSIAASAMNMNAGQTEGVFRSLTQMMSKGTVQADELRSQMSEHIPGAFGIAARAMNMSEIELNKFMEKGMLTADVFLPRFAAQLKKEFEGALPESIQSLTAEMNRGGNALKRFYEDIGGKLAPYVKTLIGHFIELTGWVQNNWDTIVGYGKTIAQIVGVMIGWKATLMAVTLVGGTFTNVLNVGKAAVYLFTLNFKALNTVMRANPLGLVATAITLVGTAAVWAYNKFDWFRGMVWGLWEAFKQVFTNIKDMVKNVIGGAVDAIAGLVNGDLARAGKGIEKLSKGVVSHITMDYLYNGVGGAYNKGYDGALAPATDKAIAKEEPYGLPDWIKDWIEGLSKDAGNAGNALSVLAEETKALQNRMKEVYGTYQDYSDLSKQLMYKDLMYEGPRQEMFRNVTSAIDEMKQLLSLFQIQNATGIQFEQLQGVNEDVVRTWLNRFMRDEDMIKQEEAMGRGLQEITGGGKSVTNITIQKAQVAENLDMNFETYEEGVGNMEDQMEAMLAKVLNDFNRTAAQ